jgi:threonine dehydrogenase-like Zn-dependent dehydrogenase
MGFSHSLAAVATKPRTTELRELPFPDVAADGGILRVVATGVCGSDWPMYQLAFPGPRILGHEIIGVVEAVGDIARDRWGVAEGDLVALEEYLPCGHCEYCRAGEYRSCLETDAHLPGTVRYGSTPISRAPGLWGGYSQFLYLHPRTVFHKVPAGVSLTVAAMALPIGNGFQWTCLDGGAGPGKVVLVHGPGQQGLGCVIAAKAAGAASIIVCGLARDAARFAVARALGADHTIAVDQQDLADEVKRATGGALADIVVDASGGGVEVINNSIAVMRKKAVFLLATRKGPALDRLNADGIVGKQIVLRGTRGHSYEAVELALQIMKQGRFPLHAMSTHVLGLQDVDRALRMVGGEIADGSIHITVDPWKA